MTPQERRARAERFSLWMERDGLAAAIAEIRAAYIERIVTLNPADKGFADAARVLSIAAKVVDQVSAHIQAAVADGSVAAADIDRMARDKALSPERKRWL